MRSNGNDPLGSRNPLGLKHKSLTKLALYFSGYGAFSDSMVVPLISAILREYSDAFLFQQNLIISGASGIFSIIGAFLAGILVRFISKRKLMIAGILTFILGGAGAVFAGGPNSLIVFRAMDGISDGVILVCCTSLIAELFPEEKERSHVYSIHQAVMAVFGSVTALFSGILCTYGWRLGFSVNFFAVISFILILLYIPDTPLETVKKGPHNCSKSEPWNPKASIFGIVMFFFLTVLINVPYFMMDILVNEKGIGSSVFTGFISSTQTILAAVSGLVFALIYMKLRQKFPLIYCFLMAAIYWIMARSNNAVILYLVISLTGIGTMNAVYYEMVISENTSAIRMGMFMGIYSVVLGLAGFAAPYVPNLLSALFGFAYSISSSLGVMAVFFLLIGLLYTVIYFIRRKDPNAKVI